MWMMIINTSYMHICRLMLLIQYCLGIECHEFRIRGLDQYDCIALYL